MIDILCGKYSKSAASLTVVYAKEAFPSKVVRSLFLAGPTPRDASVPSWRAEALELLAELGYSGHVFVPEPRSGVFEGSYEDQVEWETTALNRADAIVFWVPRNMPTMPALTTNVEWGMWYDSGKAFFGAPPEAVSVRYLQSMAQREHLEVASTLHDVLAQAVKSLGVGALRMGGETQVPLLLWNLSSFQSWYKAHVAVGNRLDYARVLWTFRMPKSRKVFSWALQVHVWICAENRVKSNEFVLSRTDISTCVLYCGDQVVLVKEFRSHVRNSVGFVYELPGGSSLKDGEDPRQVVAHEIEEETGLSIDPSRIETCGARQMVATFSAHKSHLFSVELTEAELQAVRKDAGNVHGVEADSERTYVEVWPLHDILQRQMVDWSSLGMLLSVVENANK